MVPALETQSGLMQTLYDTSIGVAVRESATLFPWIESTHVLMIAIVVGTIVIVDLRLMGYSSHRRGARQLIVDMLPFTWVAFVLALISGTLLFLSNATGYYQSMAHVHFRLRKLERTHPSDEVRACFERVVRARRNAESSAATRSR